MTASTGLRTDWNDLLAPSRRFDEGGAWTTNFPIGDTFEGEVTDPQSLHKYLFVHGDPVNFIDPTGMASDGSLIGTVATMGALVAVGLAVTWYGGGSIGYVYHGKNPYGTNKKGQPKTFVQAQTRLDDIQNMIEIFILVGHHYNAYREERGYDALNQIFRATPGGLMLRPSPGQKPAEFPGNWNDLELYLKRAQEYNYIGNTGVTVGTWSGSAGHNEPLLPGLHINSEQFYDKNAIYPVNTLVHEVTHEALWVPGHPDWMQDIATFAGSDDDRAATIKFYRWASQVKDANNKTLWDYMTQNANWSNKSGWTE